MVPRLLTLIHRTEEALISLLLALMIVLAGAQIVLRNLFDSGIDWGDPLLRILVLWVGLLGAMLATRQDKHIRVDLLTRYLPQTWKRYSAVLTHLFSAGVCALIAWHSGRFVRFEMQDGIELFSGLPAWVAEAILPLAFTVMALRFSLHAWQSLRGGTL
ncbi:MAG: TRAP transporter small permease [Pseudomonadota bacterium]